MRHRALFVLLLAASGPSRRMWAQGTHPADTSAHDSAYSAMQERGQMVMGVDQYTSIHHFDDLPNGGRITLVRAADDTAGASRIQQHLRAIAAAFAAGDFSSPMLVHMKDVPGTRVMATKKAVIRYSVRPLDRGGQLTIHTTDPDAVRAVHEFLAFQRAEHHAPH
ncbi:MAG TPA: hypothetical protein VIC24_01095 [Gemmatimonadaceae bacterium]|jgi:hypothetical protein